MIYSKYTFKSSFSITHHFWFKMVTQFGKNESPRKRNCFLGQTFTFFIQMTFFNFVTVKDCFGKCIVIAFHNFCAKLDTP